MKRQFTGEVVVRQATIPTAGSTEDMRLHSASLNAETGVLSMYLADAAGNIQDQAVTVDLSTLQTNASGGGFTVSNDGVNVLTNLVPTDLDFADVELVAVDDLDGTVSVTLQAFGTGPVVKARRQIVTKTGDDILALAEEGTAIHMNSSVDTVLSIPLNEATAFPLGSEIEIIRLGTGAVTITALSGVLLNGENGGSRLIPQQYGGAMLRKIAANEWIIIGALGDAENPFETPVYLWEDVFADHTLTTPVEGNEPGQDWTGFGVSEEQPMDEPLEWFMNNVLPQEAQERSLFDLNSPTGTAWIRGRLQPPPRSVARNITVDMTGNDVLRGLDGTTGRWGQWFLWGLKALDPAIGSVAVLGADSNAGSRTITLRDDADSAATLAAAAPGAIVELRTNTTALNYHPDSSRATMFVESVNEAARQITFTEGLPINAPESNPIGAWETSDPTTVTLLQGSLLVSDAPAGSTTINMASALGLQAGDWLLIRTEEKTGGGANQWNDGVEPNFDLPWEDTGAGMSTSGSAVPINEELHQIQAVNGNTVTLTQALGKNKQLIWEASATKIDPIDGFTLIGGNMYGGRSGGPDAWEHQYIWTRYMVNSTIRDVTFDGRDRDHLATLTSGFRRVGQVIRFDAGDNNVADNNWVGVPQRVEAGEGYGISCRLGARNTTIRNSRMFGCRHSIEFWASSGGCVAEDNHTSDTTSSCIDTHGCWNTGVIIRNNLIDRTTGAGASTDLGSDNSPDAIRIGNNKFVFDENIQVLNNRVINFDGNGLSIVPGVENVVVDGLEIRNVQRAINFAQNARHGSETTNQVRLRNFTIDEWSERCIYVNSTTPIMDDIVMENFTIGATKGPADVPFEAPGIRGVWMGGMNNLTMRNWTIHTQLDNGSGSGWGDMVMWYINGLTMENIVWDNAWRGLAFENGGNVTITSAEITIRDVQDGYLYTEGGLNNSGTLTINHNQPIGTGAGEVRVDSNPAITLNLVQI